jgi:hypothetical protein
VPHTREMCLAVALPADRDVDVLECTERLVDRGDIGGEIVVAAGQRSIKEPPDQFSSRDALFLRQSWVASRCLCDPSRRCCG